MDAEVGDEEADMMATDLPADARWDLDDPGIEFRMPAEASLPDSILLRMEVAADPHTARANRHQLERAITIALVRRDAPGVRFVPPVNPHLFIDEGFGGSAEEDDSDGGGARQEEDPRDTYGQSLEVQLNSFYGGVGSGSAAYFVVAAFAKWWAAPQLLRVRDRRGGDPAPIDAQPLSVAASATGTPAHAASRSSAPSLELGQQGTRRFLRAIFAVMPAPSAGPARASPRKPFFTIVGFKLTSRGGRVARVFTPLLAPGGQDVAAESTIALSSLTKGDGRVTAGRWVFLLFAGDRVSPPLKVTLTAADLH